MTTVSDSKKRNARLLCRASDIAENGAACVKLENRPPIAVFRIDGRFFATDDRCTHGGASLSEGMLDGEVVICPAHGGEFHIPTGRAMCFPVTRDIKCYPVVVEEDHVFMADGDAE